MNTIQLTETELDRVPGNRFSGDSAGMDMVGGGFWRRVAAWIIDWIIVSSAVSTVFLLLAAAIPGLANVVILSAPFELFTTERTLASKTNDSREPGGATLSTTETIVEEVVAGQWRYVYRVTKTKKTGPGTIHTTTTKRQQIDPVTRQDIETGGLDTIIMIALLIYWTLMEASRLQASFGKLALGMKVADEHGARLTISRAAGRNLLKLLSALILFIGFLMVAWTRRKQALHDRITNCRVVMGR